MIEIIYSRISHKIHTSELQGKKGVTLTKSPKKKLSWSLLRIETSMAQQDNYGKWLHWFVVLVLLF